MSLTILSYAVWKIKMYLQPFMAKSMEEIYTVRCRYNVQYHMILHTAQ